MFINLLVCIFLFEGCCQREEGVKVIQRMEDLESLLLFAKRKQSEQKQSVEEMKNWQQFILEQLICLQDQLLSVSEQNRNVSLIKDKKKDEDLKLKQMRIIETISSLQTLLINEVSSLQDDLQENPNSLNIDGYHTEIIMLIGRLQRIFENFLTCLSGFHLEVQEHKEGVIHDVVVCANPANPPYFLLLLKKLLEPNLRVLLSSSVHSSSPQVDLKLLKQFKDNSLKERRNYHVGFTVLWKNQSVKTLMVSPLSQIVISGEGNILRYLSRLFPSVISYESRTSLMEVSELDYLLDSIQSKLLHGNNKERQNLLKLLNSRLGSAKWLNGHNLGICDIFAWSVILQLGLGDGVPSNVNNWIKRMNELSGLQLGEN